MEIEFDEEMRILVEEEELVNWDQIIARIGRGPIQWRSTGPGYTLCVFHTAEKTASLVLRPSGSWHCYGCGKQGHGKAHFVEYYFDCQGIIDRWEMVTRLFRSILGRVPNPLQLALPYDDTD